ncbi:rab9 effector protein with kelch motifs-like [Physella acuta]|uniref:rab9 effector protein with kelch motifs-like n=1 Tax=Physella acuta TaxID=109671 RepID=UPI0027DBD7C5|nr:rab9 effector protein with kelch motifs-like [Physella acuta]XP_059140081.1 rab9 effector protein with kelch motifs-like [Physella acuta]XP_059140082.1 rab9 effector protein with kelch motifs-like [Physella acuta]
MELHPFLDDTIQPSPLWWYVLPIAGDCPSMRVGHSSVFVPALHTDESDKVFVIGGANPGQVFNEVYVLDLKSRKWDTLEATGFRGRYEHAAFYVPNIPGKIFVFGGATQSGSLNDIQALDVSSGLWSDVEVSGTPPSPRTHRSSVVIGSKVYFYSGGHSGPDPVGDRRVHCLDTSTMSWSSLAPNGNSPKPRHGHVMAAVNNKIYLHGGMAGSTFYDDLYVLDLVKCEWSLVKKKKTSPPARAAHEAIVHNKELFLFGGMNKSGALDDAYKFNTESNTWTQVKFEGPAPPNRLDFAMCTIRLKFPAHCPQAHPESQLSGVSTKVKEVLERELKPGSASSRESVSESGSVDEPLFVLEPEAAPAQCNSTLSAGDEEVKGQELPVAMEERTLVLINGGMDTEGEIFDDTLVLCL